MATIQEAIPAGGRRAGGLATEPTANRLKPVKLWAIFGVFFLSIEVIAIGGWLLSGPERTPSGPDPLPGYMSFFVHFFEIGSVVGGAVFAYYFLIRPWRREGRITLDGLLCIVFVSTFWQDSLLNYFQPWYTWNNAFFNLGAWYPWVPGWLSPNSSVTVEPLLLGLPIYMYFNLGGAILLCRFMRMVKERRPQVGPVGLIAACWIAALAFDLLVEIPSLRTGVWAYPGGIEWLTLFHGHYYQFPIYEGLLVATWFTALASCRYFRNDKGQTFGERGLDELRVKGPKKTGVRFLALVGIINFAVMVAYSIPSAIVGLYSSPWPEDITSRSYFMNGAYCGEKKNQACGGPGVPIPRRDSAHLSPDGTLIPAGTKWTPYW